MDNSQENEIMMKSVEEEIDKSIVDEKEVKTNELNPHEVYDAALSRIEGNNQNNNEQINTVSPVEKVNCPNCGVPIKKDIALCPFCGKETK